MTRSSPLSVGIDAGATAAKVVALRTGAGVASIRHAGAVSLPPGLFEGHVVKNPKTLGRLIRDWCEPRELRGASAVFSIPSSAAALRWISLPSMPPEELREAARIKVRRHLPFPASSAYLEVVHPGQSQDQSTKQSLVLAVPKAVVETRAEALVYAGLTPAAAELEAQAVLRIVYRRLAERGALWRNASLTIIDVGGRSADMYVVQNQDLQFIRTVKFGSALLAEAAAKALGVSVAEGEQALIQPGAKLTEGGELRIGEASIVANVGPELDRLIREFLRLLRYFRSLHPERSYAGILDHIVICGGLAALDGFPEVLGANLSLRVERAQPFAGLLAEVDAPDFHEVARRQEAYTVAVGLALAAVEHGRERQAGGLHEREFVWQRCA